LTYCATTDTEAPSRRSLTYVNERIAPENVD
jgi:hypothetical protein